MIIRKSRELLTYVTGVAIFLGAIAWFAMSYLATPPKYASNHKHVLQHAGIFSDIATFFDANPEVEKLDIRPDKELNVVVANQGETIEFSPDRLQSLVDQLGRAKVNQVSRKEGYLEFYAGEESKLGTYFQARVISMANVDLPVQNGEIASCSSLFIYTIPAGECLDTLGENLAIHYLWTSK